MREFYHVGEHSSAGAVQIVPSSPGEAAVTFRHRAGLTAPAAGDDDKFAMHRAYGKSYEIPISRLMNRRILIVDDEPALLDSYRMILGGSPKSFSIASSRSKGGAAAAAQMTSFADPMASTAPFELTLVSSGEEAIEQIEYALKAGHPFVGGFFDVKLGSGIDGLETIKRAKTLDPNLLCVTVTAYQDRSIDEISKMFGEFYADRWDFISKPFSNNEILQKARNLVSNWDRRKREKEYLEQIKSQQQLLIRQERMAAMGTLARGVGHEFNNVLFKIIGRAELSIIRNDPADMKESLQVIASAAQRAGVIIRNLQGLGKSEGTREACAIDHPLKDSLTLIEHELKLANVTLKEDYAANLPIPVLNRVEIGQVFLNLFINAIHAMEGKKGELKVRTFKDYTGIGIEISDTGAGIKPEHMEHLFEALFTTKGEKGSGIGLNVSKKIIDQHGGKIHVASTENDGTTFRVWLPLPRS